MFLKMTLKYLLMHRALLTLQSWWELLILISFVNGLHICGTLMMAVTFLECMSPNTTISLVIFLLIWMYTKSSNLERIVSWLQISHWHYMWKVNNNLERNHKLKHFFSTSLLALVNIFVHKTFEISVSILSNIKIVVREPKENPILNIYWTNHVCFCFDSRHLQTNYKN